MSCLWRNPALLEGLQGLGGLVEVQTTAGTLNVGFWRYGAFPPSCSMEGLDACDAALACFVLATTKVRFWHRNGFTTLTHRMVICYGNNWQFVEACRSGDVGFVRIFTDRQRPSCNWLGSRLKDLPLLQHRLSSACPVRKIVEAIPCYCRLYQVTSHEHEKVRSPHILPCPLA